MASTQRVFVIGPGFIGWNVFDLLLSEGYHVSALVRRKEQADQIASSGGVAIIGGLDDHDMIAKHTADNDITIHTASASHLPSVEAVLDGVRQRAANGRSTIYIHTSGTSVLGGDSSGNFKTNDIFYDSEPATINAVPETAPHRNIDLAILAASRELGDKAKIALMIPPAIFGFNPKHKRLSMQIPTITRFALKHGFAGYIGKGLSVWSQIHVLDLARAYIVLLRFMGNVPSSVFISNPYFFCEDGNEFSWTEAAEEVGKSLYAKGLIKDPTPKPFKREDWDDLFGDWTDLALGINSRSRAVRLRELGWKPQEKGIWESLNEDELPEILAEER